MQTKTVFVPYLNVCLYFLYSLATFCKVFQLGSSSHLGGITALCFAVMIRLLPRGPRKPLLPGVPGFPGSPFLGTLTLSPGSPGGP